MTDTEMRVLQWLPVLGEWYITLHNRIPSWQAKNEVIKAYKTYPSKDFIVRYWFMSEQRLLVTKIDISDDEKIPHIVQFLIQDQLAYCGFFVPSEDLDGYVPSWHKSFKHVKV